MTRGESFDERIAKRVMTNEEWDRRHAEHGDKTRESFHHPSGKWFWTVCPCGAKHLRVGDV